ncbi:unnamed protein product [Calicophoron daubneyi]|uniref:Uncharacterized protein n=1 Tax=Calicophoron daubneyi TaxID=300641 RepID=A0AAV2TDT2_CALDB
MSITDTFCCSPHTQRGVLGGQGISLVIQFSVSTRLPTTLIYKSHNCTKDDSWKFGISVQSNRMNYFSTVLAAVVVCVIGVQASFENCNYEACGRCAYLAGSVYLCCNDPALNALCTECISLASSPEELASCYGSQHTLVQKRRGLIGKRSEFEKRRGMIGK